MKHKIRVCMVTTSYPRFDGDVKGIFIHKLVKNLEDSGRVSVDVVKPNNIFKKLLDDTGLRYNLKSSFIAKLEFIPYMIDFFVRILIRARNCDIIHANWIYSGVPGLIAKKMYGKPLLISVRGGDIYNINKVGLVARLWRFVLKRADIIVCVSNEIKDMLNKLIEIKTEIILNGIDSNVFKPMDKIKLREELGLQKNRIILVYVGRLIEDKGPMLLLEAFNDIKDSKLFLFYVGDGGMKDLLLDKVRSLNLAERVRFFGNLEHDVLPKYLAASDIFIFPRFYEAGGNTLLEAASCGLPIIGTDEGFVKDILNYGGVFLIKKDRCDLSRAIKILVKDKRLRGILGKEARKRILQYGVGWKENSYKYIKLYKRLLV